MRFEEVLPALRQGKKIRRKDKVWQLYYVFLSIRRKEDKIDKIFSNNIINWNYTITKKDLNADDWEIIKEPKKVKLRDLTEEQYNKWTKNNCDKYDDYCYGCIFQKVKCVNKGKRDDGWCNNKDLYSDKFLDQEIEIEE